MVCCVLALIQAAVGAGDVTPLGVTRDRLEMAHDRLCSPPLGDLDFTMSDVNFTFTRRFTEYSGDVSGRMLGALNATSPLLDVEPPLLNQLLEALPACQKADGHFGVEQSLATEVNQKRDMPILWGNGRLLLALAQRCATNPDPELLKVAMRLGDYVISTRPYYGKRENFAGVGGVMASGFTTCYPSLIDGLVALGEVTKEQRFLDEARFISELSLLDKEFKGHHSHGRLTAYRGMLDLDRVSGKGQFTDAVVAGCQEISKNYVLPTGGIGEMFDLAYDRDEGCSEADWIRVNYLLWQATGDKAYLDVVDNVVRNHFLPFQFESGGFGHGTFRPVTIDDKVVYGGRVVALGSEAYWCCSMHGAQVLADLAHWAVLSQGDPHHAPSTVITFLAEAKTKVNGMEVTVKQTGPASWEVTLEARRNTHVALEWCVPGWSVEDGRPFMMLGGERMKYVEGWPTTTFPLKGTAKLQVEFSNKTRVVPVQGVIAAQVFAGGDLYCIPDAWLKGGLRDTEPALDVAFAAERPENGAIPCVVTGPDGVPQRCRLVSMMNRPKGGCRVVYKARQVTAEEFAKLQATAEAEPPAQEPVELRFACDGEINVTLDGENVYHHNGWHESPLGIVYTKNPETTGPRQVEVKVKAGELGPGIIGIIKQGGRTWMTGESGWTARPATADATKEVPVTVLGAFGTAPWNHMPGHFAATGASWVAPADPGQEREWVYRYELQ